MTVYSWKRVTSVISAVVDMQYTLLQAGRVNRDLYNRLYAGIEVLNYRSQTWESLSQHSVVNDTIKDAIKALVIEDAKFAEEGFLNSFLHVEGNPTTAEEFYAGLRITAQHPTHTEDYRTLNRRILLVPRRTAPEVLAKFWPRLMFSNIRHHPWDGTVADIRLNPDLVPENQRRYIPHTGMNQDAWTVGRQGSYTREDAVGIDSAGRIIHPRDMNDMFHVDASNLWSDEVIERSLREARQEYRNSIIRRMRQFGRGEEDEKAREMAEAKRADSLKRFEAFRAKQDRNASTAVSDWLIPTLPFVEKGKGLKSSRNWGIEVETGAGRDLSGTPDQWDAKGDGSLESAYEYQSSWTTEWIDPSDCYWSRQHDADEYDEVPILDDDGNETGEYEQVPNEDYRNPDDCDECGDVEVERDYYDDDNDDCVELVSPILSSMHSRGLAQICADIEHSPRTDTAGVHVHVEARDLTVKQVQELILGYDHIEKFIESSYDRIERGYCKRRSARELLNVARQDPHTTTLRDMNTGDRYVTVNLMSLRAHGTIEFRAMGPRYNYDHLIRWAMFCREMVNVFKNGATSKDFARVKTWNDVLAIFARFGVEYNYAVGRGMDAMNEDMFEDIEVTV